MTSEYQDMKRRLDESIYKEEKRQQILRAKRAEKKAIKKGGGGHAIARAIMPDTDFEFGYNEQPSTTETIDERIAREQAGRCFTRIVCPTCGTHHGLCAELTENKEALKMLPTTNQSSSTGRKQREGAQKWLKVDDLSTTPKEAKILMVRLNKNGRFGARVELKLAFEGQIIYWGVAPNPEQTNYAILLEKFGAEENNWVDQRIMFYLEKDKFTEQYFIRVDVPKKGRG